MKSQSKMQTFINRFLADEHGGPLMEYAYLIGLLGVAFIGLGIELGEANGRTYDYSAEQIELAIIDIPGGTAGVPPSGGVSGLGSDEGGAPPAGSGGGSSGGSGGGGSAGSGGSGNDGSSGSPSTDPASGSGASGGTGGGAVDPDEETHDDGSSTSGCVRPEHKHDDRGRPGLR